jgi:hypothetical protein
MMSYQKLAEEYIQPQYTSLKPECKNASANFSQELQFFLSLHPEFSSSKAHLDFLLYCFDYYINCDPVSRDLPLQEKLERSGEMAKNFMTVVVGQNALHCNEY